MYTPEADTTGNDACRLSAPTLRCTPDDEGRSRLYSLESAAPFCRSPEVSVCRNGMNRLTYRLGRSNFIIEICRFDSGPSTRVPHCLKWCSRLFHSTERERTRGFPRTTRPYFARVRATFRRRGSLRKPIPCTATHCQHALYHRYCTRERTCASLLRTLDMIM